MRNRHPELRGAAFGLGAAILFGVSSPFAKLLLPHLSPLMLAGLLYLGAGSALSAFEAVARLAQPGQLQREAVIRRADLGLLAAVTVVGGILGPVLMLAGLARISAVTGSLLLNLEAPFTILLAVILFREHLGWREAAAASLIIGGAAALGFDGGSLRADWPGVAAVAAACLCWAVDNNLTQRLSLRNPVAVVRIKALGAGAATLALAFASGRSIPAPVIVASALALGVVSYGLSIVLDVYALRLLGAAREAAFFATAPFVGAVAAVPVVGERFAASDFAAAAVMGTGVILLLLERHAHLHYHQALEHDHAHAHDEHHQHAHPEAPPGQLVVESHAHPHEHPQLEHAHPHVSDLHHRHRHG